MYEDGEESLDEFFQLGEDLITDEIPNFSELRDDQRATCYPFWVERYAKGEVHIHVHYGIRSRNSGREGSDWCAVFERASNGSPLPYVQVDVLHAFNPEGRVLQDGAREMGPAMLIPDVETVENPQFVPLGIIDSTVRLQPLNHCLRPALHSPHLVQSAARSRFPLARPVLNEREERGAVFEDGEFGTLRRVAAPALLIWSGGNPWPVAVYVGLFSLIRLRSLKGIGTAE